MKSAAVTLKGLNFKTPDDQAQPGMCRVLTNLYPSGDPEAIAWNPAGNAVLALDLSAYQENLPAFFNPYIWHRANLPSMLIVGWQYDNGVDTENAIKGYELNSDGYVVSPSVAGQFQITLDTEAAEFGELRYAQIGDQLVIVRNRKSQPDEMWVVRTDGGSTLTHPFNLPAAPIISVTNPSATGGVLEVGWYGFRWGLLLEDGSLCRISPVRFINATNATTPTLLFTLGTVSDPSNWNSILRGIIVFVSAKGTSPEDILKTSQFYEVGVFEKVFTSSTTLELNASNATILTKTLMREDSLMTHTIRAAEVFSYNKSALFAGVEYDFIKPHNLSFVAANPPGGGGEFETPLPPSGLLLTATRILQDGTDLPLAAFNLALSWTNPSSPNVPIGITIERNWIYDLMKYDAGPGGFWNWLPIRSWNDGGWVMLLNNPDGSLGALINQVESMRHFLT